jgi:hypothetical protein
VNLTPPDMQELGLYTARAIIPDYVPISFGHGERRLSLQRLRHYVGRDVTLDDVNPLPHPLA